MSLFPEDIQVTQKLNSVPPAAWETAWASWFSYPRVTLSELIEKLHILHLLAVSASEQEAVSGALGSVKGSREGWGEGKGVGGDSRCRTTRSAREMKPETTLLVFESPAFSLLLKADTVGWEHNGLSQASEIPPLNVASVKIWGLWFILLMSQQMCVTWPCFQTC